jgi:hypothetical protein
MSSAICGASRQESKIFLEEMESKGMLVEWVA